MKRPTIKGLQAEIAALKDQLRDYDPRKELQSGDNLQAANAKFRAVKRRLVSHMVLVDKILEALDNLGRKNVVTKEDLRQLREVCELLKIARASGLELKAYADE